MTKSIDFYFDFISPYSYLAHKKIKYLKKKDKIIFNYKPILLGGLHNLEGITAPAFVKLKLNHMITDCVMKAAARSASLPVPDPLRAARSSTSRSASSA